MLQDFKARCALFKHFSFACYAIGCFLYAIGNGAGYIAIAWLVISEVGTGMSIGILMVCFFGPNIILGPFMGVLADRYPRKWLLVLANALRAVLFIALPFIISYDHSVMVIYITMAAGGVCFSLFFATAFAFIRELVPKEQLIYANSTLDILYEAGNMLGVGIAGLLIAVISIDNLIILNGLTYVIAAIATLLVSRRALIHGGKRVKAALHVFKDMREGLTYLLARPQLCLLYGLQLIILVLFTTAPVLLVPFCKLVLHTTSGQFGHIEAAASAGVVIGGLTLPTLAMRYGFRLVSMLALLVTAVALIIFGLNSVISVAMLMYMLFGIGSSIWPIVVTRAQDHTDINFQGRVQSMFNSLSALIAVVFYLLVGLLSDTIGVRPLYGVLAAIGLTGIVLLAYLRAE